MSARARVIPLATLVCTVGALVAVRAVKHARVRRDDVVASAKLDAGASPIAHATTAAERALPASGAPRSLHADPRHTDRARATGPTREKLAWTARVGGPIEAQVVASPDERVLYAASLDGSLTALRADDGTKLWSVPLGDRVYSTPCVAPDGTLYVGSDAKRFYAISPEGVITWKLELTGEADTGAVLTTDKLVVFAAGASVYAVRAGGDVAWRFDAKKKVFTSPALADDGSVVFGSQDHRVYALSPRGALAWSTDLGADVNGSPAIADDGSIVVGTDAGEVVRLRPSGEIAWRAQVGGFVRGPLSLARDGDALAGVYGPTPRVVRVSPGGALRASFSVRGTGAREFGVQGAPLEDATGALFFGAQDDEVHAVGPEGTWGWSYRTGGDVDAPMSLLSAGALVAASDDGSVYLFAP